MNVNKFHRFSLQYNKLTVTLQKLHRRQQNEQPPKHNTLKYGTYC